MQEKVVENSQVLALVSDIAKRLERLEKLMVQAQIDERAALLARAGTIAKGLGLEKVKRR